MSVLLSRARSQHCRWIVCDGAAPARGERPDIFGGRRICGEPASWPTSYCAEHRLRVYDRVSHAPAPPPELAVRAAPPAIDQQPELTEIFG